MFSPFFATKKWMGALRQVAIACFLRVAARSGKLTAQKGKQSKYRKISRFRLLRVVFYRSSLYSTLPTKPGGANDTGVVPQLGGNDARLVWIVASILLALYDSGQWADERIPLS